MLETEDASGLDAARRLAQQAGLVGQVISIDLLHADSVLVHEGPAAAATLAQDLLERGTVLEMPMPRLAGLSMLALAAAAAGDRLETERLLAAFETSQGPREASMIPAAVHAMRAIATHDLRTANAVLDPAVAPVVAHLSTAPLHHFGLWALLRTATDDRGTEARQALRRSPSPVARQRRRAPVRRRGRRRARRPPRRAAAALHEAEELGRGDAVAAPGAADDRPRQRRDGRLGRPGPAASRLARRARAGRRGRPRPVVATCCGVPVPRPGAAAGSPPVPASLAALGVTSREADVLALLVEVPTNAEIAERLFLSRRTVETHVAHLLQKTSASTRGELLSRVAELDG